MNTRNAQAHGASSVYADWAPVTDVGIDPAADRVSAIKLTTRPDLTPAWAFLNDALSEEAAGPWQADADCATVDPDLWFPPKHANARDAKAVCQGCPVRVQCLDYALTTDDRHGVWGGMSERPRRSLRGAIKRQGLVLSLPELEVVLDAYDDGRLADYLGPLDADMPDDEDEPTVAIAHRDEEYGDEAGVA